MVLIKLCATKRIGPLRPKITRKYIKVELRVCLGGHRLLQSTQIVLLPVLQYGIMTTEGSEEQ